MTSKAAGAGKDGGRETGAQAGAPFDLFVIGGGVNGCGIARDAAGRGLSVGLAETGDLARATSSASTKMFHGGLRYLEFFEFHLVREALAEREVLWRAMPHISWPLRFVLPLHPGMRFDMQTPASRLEATSAATHHAWTRLRVGRQAEVCSTTAISWSHNSTIARETWTEFSA